MMDEFATTTCLLDAPPGSEDVVEIPLLLSQRQMNALETAAHAQGLTAAAMVRQLLGRFLGGQSASARDGMRVARPH